MPRFTTSTVTEVIMDEQIIFSLLEQRNFKELKPILSEMNGADVAHILSEVDESDLPIKN